jgi:hypothetical protein
LLVRKIKSVRAITLFYWCPACGCSIVNDKTALLDPIQRIVDL